MGDIGVGDSGGYHQRVYERMETLTRERDEARQRAERYEAEVSELFVIADGMLEFTGGETWVAELTEYPVIAAALAALAALAADPPAEAGGDG